MKSKTISVHFKRSRARAHEREIQAMLDYKPTGPTEAALRAQDLERWHVPKWARGVKVVGGHVVVATQNRGH